jgi:hypothetical protein
MGARSEDRDGFGPECWSLSVRALIVANLTRSACAEPAFVGDHGVMPGRQASGERCRFICAETRTKHQIRIHVNSRRPSLNRASCEPLETSVQLRFWAGQTVSV